MTLNKAIKHAEEVADKKEREKQKWDPCEDAISREDALMALTGEWAEVTDEIIHRFIKRIKALPPVNPQPCEDAISRQAVLDINESHHGQMPNHINYQIYQEIKALPSVNPQSKTGHWIPVSERLPEENGYYLTKTIYHEVYCDYWEEECFDRTEVVIAWMPLPKPYRKNDEI